MPQISGHDIYIDRATNTFAIQLHSYIAPYYDPASGEYMSETSWTITYGGVRIAGGYAGASNSPLGNMGFGGGDTLHTNTFNYFTLNQLSRQSYIFNLRVFDAGLSSVSQTVVGTSGRDLIVTGSAGDTVQGLGGDDIMDLGGGNDIADGGAGNDWIDGGAGDDTLTGGSGDDTFLLDSTGDVVIELSGGGYDIVEALTPSAVTWTVADHVEEFRLDGAAGSNVVGNSGANRILGNYGANLLQGLGGDDILFGGAGNDTLQGGDGDDLLDGGTGIDRHVGGLGNDTYRVDHQGDMVIENLNAGIDTVLSLLSDYTLRNNVENLVIERVGGATGRGNYLDNTITGSAGADRLYGLSGDDTLIGGDGDDVLLGGYGADTLIGGAGSDTASYADANNKVHADLYQGFGLGGEALGDSYDSIENLTGGRFDDILIGSRRSGVLIGGAGDDVIRGNDMDDYIMGGAGNDTMDGGYGDDTISYADSEFGVFIDLQSKFASGPGMYEVFAGFEHAEGSAFDDVIIGIHGYDNVLRGGAGRDTFVAHTGMDADVITDFRVDDDFLMVDFDGITSAAQVLAYGRDEGGNAIFDFGYGDQLSLYGVSVSQLTASNFLFPELI